MEIFDIAKALTNYQHYKTDTLKIERKRSIKRAAFKEDVKKELEACREIKAKYDYIAAYLKKEDSRSGLFKDIPDEELSYRAQSVLRQFLYKKLIEENRSLSYQDIIPRKAKQSVVRQKFKKMMTCDKKLMSVGDAYILSFADDLKGYFSENQLPEPGKMTVKQYTELYEHMWKKHSTTLVENYSTEFELQKEKAIYLQYLEGLSKKERESYIHELFIKNGVNNARKYVKTFSKLTD